MLKFKRIYACICSATAFFFFSTVWIHGGGQNPRNREEVSFQSGDFKIVGDLYIPQGGERHPAVVFVHGDGPASRPLSRFTRKIIDGFLETGFACLFYDKPGYGESTGELRRGGLFKNRASILVSAVQFLKEHHIIDPDHIGLWGISQAGYVMPLAVKKSKDISFMIAISCPAMDSVDQSAYLVEKQILCRGYRKDEARKARIYFKQRARARDYKEYLEAAEYLDNNPVIKSLNWGGITPEDRFSPKEPSSPSFFNPIEIIKAISIPVLAIFGDTDTQIDPIQGALAYEKVLKQARNPFFQVKLFPKANHGIIVSETGCMDEMRDRYSSGKSIEYAPGYLELMNEWLAKLKQTWK
ncbi:alpha/beta hydrolase family protein [Acidobacteriota bacterium]